MTSNSIKIEYTPVNVFIFIISNCITCGLELYLQRHTHKNMIKSNGAKMYMAPTTQQQLQTMMTIICCIWKVGIKSSRIFAYKMHAFNFSFSQMIWCDVIIWNYDDSGKISIRRTTTSLMHFHFELLPWTQESRLRSE